MRGNKLYKKLDSWVGQAGIVALAAIPAGRTQEPGPGFAPRRILVIKLSALGDTLLLVPALRELRRRYPGAQVGMVGTAVNRGIAAELPRFIDRFYCLEPGRAMRDPRYLAGFVRDLAREGWELGIDFDQWTNVTPLLLRMARVPVRVGFRTRSRFRHLLYTHAEPRDPRSHEAENFLRLLRPLGIEPPAPVLELDVRDEAVARVRGLLRDAGWNGADPLLVVHAGCGHAHPRAWPVERYRELCTRMAAEGSTFFAFTGAGSEAADAESLAASLPGRAAALTALSIPEWVACVSLGDLVLSGNTGAMHVAAALGRPQVFLEGPNDPGKWGPINPRAVGVFSTCPGCPCLDMGWEFHRTDGFCMEQITVDEVHEVVTREMRGRALSPEC
jgi:ADP-heptose:LPS heptosyltransferase